jgi:hypothetical protein
MISYKNFCRYKYMILIPSFNLKIQHRLCMCMYHWCTGTVSILVVGKELKPLHHSVRISRAKLQIVVRI